MMIVMIQNAEIYMFDEPTSYLDVKQRIKMAKLVRNLQTLNNYIIVVEHDLSILESACINCQGEISLFLHHIWI